MTHYTPGTPDGQQPGTPPQLSEVGTAVRPPRPRRTGLKIAVGLIALLTIGGLVFAACSPLLGLAPNRPSASPDEIAPGPKPAATLDGYYGQELSWQPCWNGKECAVAHAPLDWSEPGGDSITLALVRLPAAGGAPLGSLLVNPGGPGASGVETVAQSAEAITSEQVRNSYDIVGWDPRGVGNSSAVSCLTDAEMDEYLFGVSEAQPGSPEWLAEAEASSAEFGEACQENTGPLLGTVDTISTAHDLDMLRAVLGDQKLNYLGFSYGTSIGAQYAEAFPENVGRLVLDGAIDPTSTESETVKFQTEGFENATRAYLASCLKDANCPFEGTVDAGMAEIGELMAQANEEPLIGSDGRAVSSGTLFTAIIYPLYSQQSWPYLNDLFAEVREGKADTALALADGYYGRNADGTYRDNSFEAFMAINCLDYPRDADPERMRAQAEELAELAPTFGSFQGYGGLACANWPYPTVTPNTPVSAEGADPILVVGTTGDPATPYRWAVSLAEQLDSGVLLSFEGEGHTAYRSAGNACVDGAVDAYLLDGTLPADEARC
ncbi:alpha/beta hydrolase [Leucobacter sp. M11]|uniref:alpha/beta hydrolase n=1 Tax=Leucobacter sp. M11 TaxID=2993565 RepID=UPI002D806DB3|nr:alpha/beta hydrolase [Leucobacter sp. M11]MEB4615254.1 alpha/beta hydrolase [Leucobacter sp. M11]